MRESYINRVSIHLAATFPEAVKKLRGDGSDQPLRAFIDAGITKAARFNVTAERNVMLFIDLMTGLSPDFFEQKGHAWTAEILNAKDLTETEKMDVILQRLKAAEASAEKRSA